MLIIIPSLNKIPLNISLGGAMHHSVRLLILVAIMALICVLPLTLTMALEGPQVGAIAEIKHATREIIVKTPLAAKNIKMGDKLYVRVDGKAVVIQATFPMQTIAKCMLDGKYAGYWGKIVKGMTVYRYVPGVEEEVDAIAAEPKTGSVKKLAGIEFVFIEGGKFMMGQPDPDIGCKGCSGSEQPVRKVTVGSFWMGKYEVTQKQYQSIMGKNPSHFKGDNHPVEMVTWYDAVDFCNKMSGKAGLTPYYKIDKNKKDQNNKNKYDKMKWTVLFNEAANGFRLPTEAEWEFACRAGSTTKYYWGDSIDGNYLWFLDNSNNTTHPVGEKLPNAWGLYDISGNVWEWCQDWFDNKYNGKSPYENPPGPVSGQDRVIRGGSWGYYYNHHRSTFRVRGVPDSRYSSNGFRLLLAP